METPDFLHTMVRRFGRRNGVFIFGAFTGVCWLGALFFSRPNHIGGRILTLVVSLLWVQKILTFTFLLTWFSEHLGSVQLLAGCEFAARDSSAFFMLSFSLPLLVDCW